MRPSPESASACYRTRVARVLFIDSWPGISSGCGTGLGSTLFKLAAAADAARQGHWIEWLTSREKAELLEGSSAVRAILTDPDVDPDSYDVCLSLGLRLPFERANLAPFTEEDRAAYKLSPHLSFWRSYLGRILGYASPDRPAEFPLAIRPAARAEASRLLDGGARWIGVAPAAISPLKRYHEWDRVVELLLARDPECRICLLAKENLPFREDPRILNLTGKTPLSLLPAVLERCDVIAGSDGLVPNLGAVLGRPTVALFSIIDPASVIDPDQMRRSPAMALVERGCPYQFCYPKLENYRTSPCLLEPGAQRVRCMRFSPEKVADAVEAMARSRMA